MNELRKIESAEQINFNMRFEGVDELLVPVICIDNLAAFSVGGIKAVRMVGYASQEAMETTLTTGFATFYSRSRDKSWTKGEESGNTLDVNGVYTDCDADVVLLDVKPNGPTCHTGADTCFLLDGGSVAEIEEDRFDPVIMKGVWDDAMAIKNSVIAGKAGASETYTQRTAKDINTIVKKIGEEAVELVRAYTLGDKEATKEESTDLFYRMIFLLAEADISPQEFFEAIGERNKK